MGEVTVIDHGHYPSGRPTGAERVARHDPAAEGKAIRGHAVPRQCFTGVADKIVYDLGAKYAEAVGTPIGGNLFRTSGWFQVYSDGYEARFHGWSPRLSQVNVQSIVLDDRLSEVDEGEHRTATHRCRPRPVLDRPWHDAEMLGHSMLKVMRLAVKPLRQPSRNLLLLSTAPVGPVASAIGQAN